MEAEEAFRRLYALDWRRRRGDIVTALERAALPAEFVEDVELSISRGGFDGTLYRRFVREHLDRNQDTVDRLAGIVAALPVSRSGVSAAPGPEGGRAAGEGEAAPVRGTPRPRHGGADDTGRDLTAGGGSGPAHGYLPARTEEGGAPGTAIRTGPTEGRALAPAPETRPGTPVAPGPGAVAGSPSGRPDGSSAHGSSPHGRPRGSADPTDRPRPTGDIRNTVEGGTAGTVVQVGLADSLVIQAPAGPSLDDWLPLPDVDPEVTGVRPSGGTGDEPYLPPYVPRDADTVLAAHLRGRLTTGGLVVITGGPLTGKSLTAWSVLAAVAPAARVYVPEEREDLRALPALLRHRRADLPHVLWLDGLDGHLHEHGLTRHLLWQFVRQRTLVLGTLRADAYDSFPFGSPGRRVLESAAAVRLPGMWSPAELAALRRAPGDRRLEAARDARGATGVTQFLALGDALWKEWQLASRGGGRPGGHLLVRAALDLTRRGIPGPLPSGLLRALFARYAEEADTVGEPPAFDGALAWAAEVRHGVAGLLVPAGEAGSWAVHAALVAEAVRRADPRRVSRSHAEDTAGRPDLPVLAWYDIAVALRDGVLGDRSEVLAAAEAALGPPASRGDTAAWAVLGHVHEAAGSDGAASCFRRAADGDARWAGDAGEFLVRKGKPMEALPYLAVAAGRSPGRYAGILATTLEAQAAQWRQVADGVPHRPADGPGPHPVDDDR